MWRALFISPYMTENEAAAGVAASAATAEASAATAAAAVAAAATAAATEARITGRGLESSTFQLNESAFCGIGGAFRGCPGGVLVVRGDTRAY